MKNRSQKILRRTAHFQEEKGGASFIVFHVTLMEIMVKNWGEGHFHFAFVSKNKTVFCGYTN